MSKIYLFLITMFTYFECFSQTDVDNVFKTLLVLNNSITVYNGDGTKIKNIETLIESVNIEIIELKGIDSVFKPSFFLDYKLYSFNPDLNKIGYKKETNGGFNFGACKEYIIAYNEKRKRYYRLKGFNNNDFNSLLGDIILYNESKIKAKSIVKELDQMYSTNIDFNCLYKFLKDSPKNRLDYPCMIICTDPIISR